VFGGLGLLCNGCGTVMNGINMMGGQSMQMPGPDGKPMVLPDIMKPGPVDIAGGVAGFLLSIVLVVAGSMLVARNPVARMLHLAYAILGSLLTLGFTAFSVMKLMGIKSWAAKNPDNPAAKMADMITGFGMLGIAVGLLFGLAYPVFILIWFGAMKRDAREISAGVEERAA
jgi:hypothetical protein